LVARYGVVGAGCKRVVGMVQFGKGRYLHDGVRVAASGWFADNLWCNVGNGATTLFWLDRWVGDVPLRDMFRRLFELFDTKMSYVAQMVALGWGEGGEAWKWRRRL
jgi:hypothetical protein